MFSTTRPTIGSCPKSMALGPCGGVSADGSCEIDSDHACVFLDPARAARRDQDERTALLAALPPDPAAAAQSGLRRRLESGDFTVVTELNGPDGVNLDDYVAAAGRLRAAGIETIATFACLDRNRIGLQGDLLGAASLGIQNVLCVTGNHPQVGDSPTAKPVFDLDGSRLVALADRLRKVALGADFIISQHIFDLVRWRRFVQLLGGERGALRFHLLGGIAILPDGVTARRVNAGLRGFKIPEETLRRLDQSATPQQTGIDIAAETVAELAGQPGVAGALLAPVVNRGTNALTASAEQADVIRAVREQAGVAARAAWA